MAKNWSASEAINTLHEGTDTAAIRDIMTHFPDFALLAIKSNEAAATMFSFMPEWMTARKVNNWIKNADKATESEEDEDETEEDEKPSKKPNKEAPAKKKSKKAAAKKAKDEDEDDEDDDEDEDEPPAKKSKKPAKKAKKAAADDDDFDFE